MEELMRKKGYGTLAGTESIRKCLSSNRLKKKANAKFWLHYIKQIKINLFDRMLV